MPSFLPLVIFPPLPLSLSPSLPLPLPSSLSLSRQSLTSPASLSSIDQLKEAIHLWLQDLHCYHNYLTSSCAESSEKDVFYELPYCGIDGTLRQSVKEIVTLALELEVFSCEDDQEGKAAGVHEFLSLFGALVDVPRAREVLSHYPLATMCGIWRSLAKINIGEHTVSWGDVPATPDCCYSLWFVIQSD